MNNKRMIIGLSLLAAALFVLPTVTAQSVTPDAQGTRTGLTPIKPEIESQQITLAWNYNFDTTLHSLSGLARSTPPATVNIRCADPTNIIISGPTTVGVPLDVAGGAGSTQYSFSANYFVSVTRDLPGLKQFRCDYDVDVPAVFQDAVPGTGAVSGGGASNFIVTADYYGLVQAKVTQQIKQAGPQKDVPFEITLDNLGNARTTIQFAVEERPEGDRWVAAVPDDVILASPTNPVTATTDTAVFTVTTPYKTGWNNDQGTYRLRLNTFAADDPERSGPDLFSNMIVRVRGVYVPGFEPVALLGAVVGAALLARSRNGIEEEETDE